MLKIEISFSYTVVLSTCQLKTILHAFSLLMNQLIDDFFNKVLLAFAEYYMHQKKKPFVCHHCGNDKHFSWKTRHGKLTKIVTVFKTVCFNQLQIKCDKCGHKMYITRGLLGLSPMERIPQDTRRKFALMGALTTFRVSEKIAGLFGWAVNKMTIWRSVQEFGKGIEFGLDENELAQGEADGTGIPVYGGCKRGKEMKVFVQKKKDGGIRIANIVIGMYDTGWDKLFEPLKKGFDFFKEFILITDGDGSILKGLKDKVKIIFQRCLWHIPHQLKYYLWFDKVPRKGAIYIYIMSKIHEICSVKTMIYDDDIIKKIILNKSETLDFLISYCEGKKLKTCASYLRNAKPDMFRCLEKKFNGKTTSKVERVMKTINMRINVGKWSDDGALNVSKIRLAYYYNDLDVE